MPTDTPPTRRDRVRAQTLAEIREHAWAQVDAGGADGLSLNAIAKAMGMSGPALYRYYGSRDELVGALVLAGYADLVGAIEDAARTAARRSPARRVAAVAEGYRAWALAHPRRYTMLFEPRPGAVADSGEAIATVHRGMVALLTALADAGAAPTPAATGRDRLDQQLVRWARSRDTPLDLPPATLRAGVLAWTHLHGTVSLELAGALPAMGLDADLVLGAGLERLTGA